MKVANHSHFFSYSPITLTKEDLEKRFTSSFATHPLHCSFAKKAERLSHYISLPFRVSLRCLAYSFEPLPGEYKNHSSIFILAKKIAAFALAILLSIPALVSLAFALPLHAYSHAYKSDLSMIHNPKVFSAKTSPESLHVRTHNLGFVYEFFRVVGDLRDVKTRACEIAAWIENDPALPEVIVFQEGFHIDATEILCNRLKEKYPYVIHSIAPHISGLNNGAIIASRHPIQEFSYRPFDNMLGPERWSTRGLLKIRIEKEQKKFDIYAAHLQALLGKSRAEVRKTQMQQIVSWIDEDQKKNQSDIQILLGDMNASKISVWGEENHEDDGCFDIMSQHFHDLFLNDHDELGQRTKGDVLYTRADSPDELQTLPEPTGSWYIGPFAHKGVGLQAKEWYERVCNGLAKKRLAKQPPTEHHWGTKKWSSKQLACTARLDYILRYKQAKTDQRGLSDRAEIRRVKVSSQTQSAPSDHLPVDGVIKV